MSALLNSVVDPNTMATFWGALIALMIASKTALDQYNAAKSKERREADAQLAAKNTAQTNGAIEDLHRKVDTIQKNGSTGLQAVSNSKTEATGATPGS